MKNRAERLSLTCGCSLIERETARQQLERSTSSQSISWDTLQKVFVSCLQSNSSVAKQETVAFFERLWQSNKADEQTLAEKILNGIESTSYEDSTQTPLELFHLWIQLLFALQSDSTRSFYLVRLLSHPHLDDILLYALCEYFMNGRKGERLNGLQMLLLPFSTLVCEGQKSDKIFHFLLTIYDCLYDDLDSIEKKTSLLNIILQLLALKKSLSPCVLGLVHKLWSSTRQDLSHRAIILHYVLAQGFEGRPELLLSLWSSTKNNLEERKLWQQTVSYFFGGNHWISITVWLMFLIIRMGKVSAALEMKQLLEFEKLSFKQSYAFIDVILTVVEYEYPHFPWRETWFNDKQAHHHTTSEEPMSRNLYGHSSTIKLKVFRHFPKYIVAIHMLEDFLQQTRMEELLWKWYVNLKNGDSTSLLELWFAICLAHLWRESNNNNSDKLSSLLHIFHQANSLEKLTFLPILFRSKWWCSISVGRLTIITWFQSWFTSCPIESYYSLVIHKWMCSIVKACKRSQSFRMYTLMVSVMVKESVIRGEPWKTSVVEEICYAIRFFPSDLQPIAYQWMEYIAKERATWIAYSLFSNVQQPLITSSLVPDIAACCIRIVCQLCQVKLLDYTKTFQTLCKYCSYSVCDHRELELAWIEFFRTGLMLSFDEADNKNAFYKYLMASDNICKEIFQWSTRKLVNCDIEDHKYLQSIMDTWLLCFKACLSIQSVTGNVLIEWNVRIETVFDKFFSRNCHEWLKESEDTLHQLVKMMIQAVQLEWQYRKRMEWSAIERDHSIRKWSFAAPSLQEWLEQLENYISQCPCGIVQSCLRCIFVFISSLCGVNRQGEEEHKEKLFQGFYALWILSYSEVVVFQKLFWQKWLDILYTHRLTWMEQCHKKLGWKYSTFMFWQSFWSRWSVHWKGWSMSKWLEEKERNEVECFYILWDLLVGYRPLNIQPSISSFQSSSTSTYSMEEIEQNIPNWWKELLFHVMETRLVDSVENLSCVFRFGDWADLTLLYQKRATKGVFNVYDKMKDWMRRKLRVLFQQDAVCDVSLLKVLDPCKSSRECSDNILEKSAVNIRYYCMQQGLYDWNTAFGMQWVQSWMAQPREASLHTKEIYLDCYVRYGFLQAKNLEQMVQTWVECLSNTQDKEIIRLEFLYNAWIESRDAKMDNIGHPNAFEDALVQCLGWYQILFSHQNVDTTSWLEHWRQHRQQQ